MFNLAMAIALALCVATLMLWVRSFDYLSSITYTSPIGRGSRHFSAVVQQGKFGFSWYHFKSF